LGFHRTANGKAVPERWKDQNGYLLPGTTDDIPVPWPWCSAGRRSKRRSPGPPYSSPSNRTAPVLNLPEIRLREIPSAQPHAIPLTLTAVDESVRG
jgi:hypothetical protein